MKMSGLSIVGLLLVSAMVVAEPGSYAGEVTASRLQLRAGPGESYQTVLTLEKGNRFIVRGPHANAPEWLRVEIPGGFEAWVFARFMKRDVDGMGEMTADMGGDWLPGFTTRADVNFSMGECSLSIPENVKISPNSSSSMFLGESRTGALHEEGPTDPNAPTIEIHASAKMGEFRVSRN